MTYNRIIIVLAFFSLVLLVLCTFHVDVHIKAVIFLFGLICTLLMGAKVLDAMTDNERSFMERVSNLFV